MDSAIKPTPELIAEIDALYEKATKGPWSMHKPGCCRSIDFRDGVILQMMNDKVDMQDATGLAPTPEQAIINQQLIVALVNSWPAIKQALSTARANAFEEAAKVCENLANEWPTGYEEDALSRAQISCAQAIRALAKERA